MLNQRVCACCLQSPVTRWRRKWDWIEKKHDKLFLPSPPCPQDGSAVGQIDADLPVAQRGRTEQHRVGQRRVRWIQSHRPTP